MLLIQQLSPDAASCMDSGLMLIKPWNHPSWSNGLIADYSGDVDRMSGISYLLDLVELPCGEVINPGFTLKRLEGANAKAHERVNKITEATKTSKTVNALKEARTETNQKGKGLRETGAKTSEMVKKRQETRGKKQQN